jgi:hypothetical protein
MGAEVTPGGQEEFDQCFSFFTQKANQAEELGDKEAQEIEQFIGNYENSA